MPSIGRVKQLTVLGVAAAILGVTASSASAADNEIWFWACHGPDGAPVTLTKGLGATTSYSGTLTNTCADPAGALSATLNSSDGTIGGYSEATSVFDIPSGLQVSAVKLTRSTRGFGGSSTAPLRYQARTQAGPLEQIRMDAPGHADSSGEKTLAATASSTGDQLRIGVLCDSATVNTPCASSSPVGVDISRVGIQAAEITSPTDNGAPHMAVGGITDPAAGTLNLDIQATDGVGLDFAEAWFDGQPKTAQFKFNGTDAKYAGCKDLTPATATVIDLPLDAVCPTVAPASLSISTAALANGPAAINVRVVDLAGKEVVHRQAISILNNPYLGVSSQTLSIGTSGIIVPTTPPTNPPGGGGGGGGGGAVTPAQAQSCSSPRLSAILASKPVPVSKGVPVLRYRHRYRFTGRLTCVVNGKRKSAPKRTRIDLFTKIGKRTAEKSGTTIRDKGRFSMIVAYPSSRTLTFRFTNAAGKRSQVSIKVKVEKKKKKK